MNYLALQVSEVNDVEVHDAQPSHARGGKVKRQRGTQPSRADAEHFRSLQLKLPFHADFRHDEVTAVAKNFVFAQLDRGR